MINIHRVIYVMCLRLGDIFNKTTHIQRKMFLYSGHWEIWNNETCINQGDRHCDDHIWWNNFSPGKEFRFIYSAHSLMAYKLFFRNLIYT